VLKGNIRIISDKNIYITQQAKLENVILYGKNIFINRGFHGHLQAFAQDSIIAGEGCRFDFPSCIAILNQNINSTYLEVKKKTFLAGCIFIYQENLATNPPYLEIEKEVNIHGQVYCPGTVEISGKITGSLYCNSFVLRTQAAYYENHLLNCVIDNRSISPYFAGTPIIPGYNINKSIAWLY
jgi:cytoskeletal protein CcmA (bactofilin family)